MNSSAVVTTEDGGRQNMFAKEPLMYVDPKDVSVTYWERAEMTNGRLAMFGFLAAVLSYAVTGQIIPGLL